MHGCTGAVAKIRVTQLHPTVFQGKEEKLQGKGRMSTQQQR